MERVSMTGTKVICHCCGATWTVAEVRGDSRPFIRRGCVIGACPECLGTRPNGLEQGRREELERFAGLAAVCGDHLEEYAWLLELFRIV